MAEYLFLFTIGPVQDFIAAARRTRDLWAGSQLLSELSRRTAKTLRDVHKAQLIFPAPVEGNEDFRKHDVVNRVLAQIFTDNPKSVGQKVEETIRSELKTICNETFDAEGRIEWSTDMVKNHRVKAELQVADLIEIYWAAVLDTGNYQWDRDQVEAVLSARKYTRHFNQPTAWASAVPKSSIDGVRESVIDEDEYAPPGATPEQRRVVSERLYLAYGAKGAERLSGVDLLKRHYRPQNIYSDFPSTSHFAALPLLARHRLTLNIGLGEYLELLRSCYREQPGGRRIEALKLDRRFEQLVSIYNYDASILFASRLEEDLEGDVLKVARLALEKYLRTAFEGKEPEPYYALLHADGDFMGRTIDTLAARTNGRHQHRIFSQKLDSFASDVRRIVEVDHLGALVYSGGDDVLALVPLHTVVQCARDLANSFETKMNGLELTEKPSLSVGIAICHHLEPLSDALDLAREAERIAKKVSGKNALAITLSKRGGVDRTISGSWTSKFDQRLRELTEWHRYGAIPDSAAYDLHDLVERVGATLPPAALKVEAIRIIRRKRGQRGQADGPNADLVHLVEALPESSEAAKDWGLPEFANELIVTREFARAQGYVDVVQGKGIPT